MKRKEVEDVMGGKDAWANVDRMDGECHVMPTPPLENHSSNLFLFARRAYVLSHL